MVDNLAKKGDECPLNQDHLALFTIANLECETCPLYGLVGCPLFNVLKFM